MSLLHFYWLYIWISGTAGVEEYATAVVLFKEMGRPSQTRGLRQKLKTGEQNGKKNEKVKILKENWWETLSP